MYVNSHMKAATDYLSKKYRCKKNLLDYIGLWEFVEAGKRLLLFNIEDPTCLSFRSTVAYDISNR